MHAQLAGENRAGVLKAAGRAAHDVMLLPLQGRDGPAGPLLPIFAAFMAPLLGGDFVRQVRAGLVAARCSQTPCYRCARAPPRRASVAVGWRRARCPAAPQPAP